VSSVVVVVVVAAAASLFLPAASDENHQIFVSQMCDDECLELRFSNDTGGMGCYVWLGTDLPTQIGGTDLPTQIGDMHTLVHTTTKHNKS
jgi:hypothetical protein